MKMTSVIFLTIFLSGALTMGVIDDQVNKFKETSLNDVSFLKKPINNTSTTNSKNIDNRQDEYTTWENKFKAWELRLNQMRDRLNLISTEINDAKAETERETASINATRDSLKTALEKYNQEVLAYEAAKAQLDLDQTNLDKFTMILNKDNEKYTREMNQLNQNRAILEAAKKNLDADRNIFEASIAELMSMRASLARQWVILKNKQAQLADDIKAYDLAVKEMNTQRESNVSYTNDNYAYHLAYQKFLDEQKAFADANAMWEIQYKQKNAYLDKDMETWKNTVRTKNGNLNKKEFDVAQLELRAKDADNRRQVLMAQLKEMRRQNNIMMAKIAKNKMNKDMNKGVNLNNPVASENGDDSAIKEDNEIDNLINLDDMDNLINLKEDTDDNVLDLIKETDINNQNGSGIIDKNETIGNGIDFETMT